MSGEKPDAREKLEALADLCEGRFSTERERAAAKALRVLCGALATIAEGETCVESHVSLAEETLERAAEGL